MSSLFRSFCYNSRGFFCKSFHASSSVRKDAVAEFMFNIKGFNKYGLLQDDFQNESRPEIKEAIRRLPEEQQMQRIYRAIRASQAEINHSVLPKDQWTKFTDDHFYLQPYIEEVLKENEEMKEWEANH